MYFCDLPKQLVTETTDGKVHHRDGVERHGSSPCAVISASDYNDSQANGLIVVPIIGGVNVDIAKFKKVPPAWLRVVAIDRARCRRQIGQLLDFDLFP